MTVTATPNQELASITPERKGHPLGLYILFATEMWERFSYYGMRALLVLYMIHQLKWQPADSSGVYKWYTSLVYLTPLLGGFLADRWLGLRVSIVIGGVLMAVGHFLMAFEPLPIFYAALGFLVFGNGFFKPNISTLVGRMYADDDPRRDSAFTIFYMGINLGAFVAPLVCGWLRTTYGFHYGFAAAGVGMIIGLVIFLTGQRRVLADIAAAGHHHGASERTTRQASAEADPDELLPGSTGFPGLMARAVPFLMIGIALFVPAATVYAYFSGAFKLLDTVMPIAFSGVAGWMGWTLFSIKGRARDKSTVIFVLFGFTVVFWMAFEQAGNALNVWADAHTDLSLGSWQVPPEYFQMVNPVLILALAPVFSILWSWLARRGREISTPAKMLAAMLLVALSFAAMVGAAQSENQTVTRAPLAELPLGLNLTRLDAGRLTYDPAARELSVHGVLPPFAVKQALEAASPSPPPAYAAALQQLGERSNGARASSLWLVLSYFLATLGELCLSPVGLSMVTKLAPTRFASLFMGVWLLGSSVAQYVGGSLGERWGIVPPVGYFTTFVVTSLVGALLLVLLVRPLKKLMHDAAASS